MWLTSFSLKEKFMFLFQLPRSVSCFLVLAHSSLSVKAHIVIPISAHINPPVGEWFPTASQLRETGV